MNVYYWDENLRSHLLFFCEFKYMKNHRNLTILKVAVTEPLTILFLIRGVSSGLWYYLLIGTLGE